jgi:hypothetical protein
MNYTYTGVRCTNPKLPIILFYDLENNSVLNFVPYVNNQSPYSGITLKRLCTDNTFSAYNVTSTMIVEGYRILPNGVLAEPYFNETYTIQLNENSNEDMLVFTGSYPDDGTTLATNNGSRNFLVLGGSGIFDGYTKVSVQYTTMGSKRVRYVTVTV